MSAPVCTARRHGGQYAYRLGCRHPEAVEAMRGKRRRDQAARRARAPRGTGWYQPRHRDVDEVAVELLLAGRLGTRERWAVIDRLTDAGCSARDIAQRLRITERTVMRRRAARRAEEVSA